MKLVHFRALWAGEKQNGKKSGPQIKNSLCFGRMDLGMLS